MDDRQAARSAWTRVRHDREAAVVGRLRRRAREATDAVEGATAWLAVQRQAGRYLRGLAWARTPAAEHGAHAAVLAAAATEAERALAGTPRSTLAPARRRLGIRVALVGKGGAGKSMVGGTLARLLARGSGRVLAADLDTNPGLAYSLGTDADGLLPDELIETHAGAPYGFGLRSGADPHDAGLAHAAFAPDGVRFLAVGKILSSDKRAPRRTLTATTELLTGFGEPDWHVVGDLEAGPSTPFVRYHAFADVVLVVVTPTWVSAMTARRLLPILDGVPAAIVGNGFGHEPDHAGLEPLVRIPFDPAVAEAERLGLAPLDHCPDAPAVAAVARLAQHLQTEKEVTA